MDKLPDLLQPGLKLVFCGTAAGAVSAARGCYYAGPGNRFWPTLFAIGLTPRRFRPDEFRLLLDHRIGLTDVVKQSAGADVEISFTASDRDRLVETLRRYRPGMVAFNGKKAAREFLGLPSNRALAFGPHPALAENLPPMFVLPSSSGAASGHWNVAYWHELAQAAAAIQL